MSEDQRKVGQSGARTARKPYRAPELKEYGSVSKLTQAGPGSDMEGSTSFRIMATGMCL